tara:strand:- start:69323 stop:71707 length:2385 start_codon:yes stop_codon:yes gene_type:complete
MKKIILMFLISLVQFLSCQKFDNLIEIKSPSGLIKIMVLKNYDEWTYEVFYLDKKIISNSKLGIVFKDRESPFTNSEVIDIKRKYHDEYWELPWGEVSKIRNNYNEAKITYANNKNFEVGDLIFRAYDDGIAFRYYVKEGNEYSDSSVVINEMTEFNMVEDAEVWWTPAYTSNRYEELYRNTKLSDMDTSHTPLTMRFENGTHVSIHEASLKNYSSMQIYSNRNSQLNCDLAPWSNGDKVRTKSSFYSPWRTVIITSSAKDLITSYLVLNCNEPSKIKDSSWIKPSKYIGIWWGMIIGKWTWGESLRHGATNERSFRYIDFAAENGFDEVLIEGWAAGWKGLFPEDSVTVSFTKSTPDFNLKQVQDYADSKGVRVQAYHETMANTKNYLSQIDSAFSLMNNYGLRNAKIGQVGRRLDKSEFHYGQYGVDYYRKVLNKALEYKIGVNFHEPIKDTGERRTYPNMLTREGARGMEYNAWQGGNPPSHTTVLPFTRLLNSPMDFTPGIFDLLYENLDLDISKEYPITFTIVDSGNGYSNLRFKSGESIWFEKKMVPDTIITSEGPIYTWKISQGFQVGEWEWGVTADHIQNGAYNIWIPKILENKKNRKIEVLRDGSFIGENSIIIPYHGSDTTQYDYFLKKPKDSDKQRVKTTISKQLALYLVIYSPLQMASDFIENYIDNPAFQFIKDVPIDWDSTIVLNGEIGQYVTIARKEKNSENWYVGSITNENQRIMDIDFSFLGNGLYEGTIYADAEESDWKSSPLTFEIHRKKFTNRDIHQIKLSKGGGQAISLKLIE